MYLTMDVEATKDQHDNAIPYDISYVIHNRKGEIVKERSFLIKEVYMNTDLMKRGWYYKKHMTKYPQLLNDGIIKLVSYADMKMFIAEDLKEYMVHTFLAYNAMFDITACSNLAGLMGDNFFFDDQLKLVCIMYEACTQICNTKSYHDWANKHPEMYYSASGNIKTTAEHVARFLKKDVTFIEDHTGLSDAILEAWIFSKCRGALSVNTWTTNAWKLAQIKS